MASPPLSTAGDEAAALTTARAMQPQLARCLLDTISMNEWSPAQRILTSRLALFCKNNPRAALGLCLDAAKHAKQLGAETDSSVVFWRSLCVALRRQADAQTEVCV